MIMSIRFPFFISRLYRNRSIKYHSFRAPNDGILFHELSTFCEQTIDNRKQTHVTCITSQIAVMWYLANLLNVFLDKVVECCVRRMLKHVSNSQEKAAYRVGYGCYCMAVGGPVRLVRVRFFAVHQSIMHQSSISTSTVRHAVY